MSSSRRVLRASECAPVCPVHAGSGEVHTGSGVGRSGAESPVPVKRWRSAGALAVLVLAVALTGCGHASPGRPAAVRSPAPPPPSGVNPTDVMFVQMILPHHRQGTQIARLATGREPREEVRLLAAAIDTTQSAEVDTLEGWLRGWHQPETASDVHAHDAHGGVPATSLTEIAALQKASGADFDRRFLDTMIAHQDDAVQLARMELAGGLDPQTRDFATRLDRSRTAQIQRMLFLRDNP
ncbi:MAG: hypothetical protein QOI74_1897 [Micromonosporaceae bacterium]|nr:hypothetical protein [Micromonosporaceae bacterium]